MLRTAAPRDATSAVGVFAASTPRVIPSRRSAVRDPVACACSARFRGFLAVFAARNDTSASAPSATAEAKSCDVARREVERGDAGAAERRPIACRRDQRADPNRARRLLYRTPFLRGQWNGGQKGENEC